MPCVKQCAICFKPITNGYFHTDWGSFEFVIAKNKTLCDYLRIKNNNNEIVTNVLSFVTNQQIEG